MDKATEIWFAIEADLDDRGCFNGINDDVMDDLRMAQIRIIKNVLSAGISAAVPQPEKDAEV